MDQPLLDQYYENICQDGMIEKLAKMEPFDAKKWLQWFEKSSFNQKKMLRMVVSEGTMHFCNIQSYTLPDLTSVPLPTSMDEVLKQVQATTFHLFIEPEVDTFPAFPTLTNKTEFGVLNYDCVDLGIYLKKQGLNPIVLNMCSPNLPGGGYRTGAGAQEESIFRRSNYFQVLGDPEELTPTDTREWGYPLPEFCGIYSPDILVFRKSEFEGYELLKEPIPLSFVAVAAYRRPGTMGGGPGVEPTLKPNFVPKILRKVKQILAIALMHGHDSIVLGAIGCGAYSNPPTHIAKIFHSALRDPQFKGKFRSILFAIFDDANTRKDHNPDGNLKPFLKIFDSDLTIRSVDMKNLYN